MAVIYKVLTSLGRIRQKVSWAFQRKAIKIHNLLNAFWKITVVEREQHKDRRINLKLQTHSFQEGEQNSHSKSDYQSSSWQFGFH